MDPREIVVHRVSPDRHVVHTHSRVYHVVRLTGISVEDMDLPADLLALARNQFGVMSRVQLVQSGVSRAQIRWRLGRAWRLLLPGVVLLEPGLPTLSQRYVAALLYAGPESWLSGPTALRLHGWPSAEPSLRVHVLVPPTHRSRDVAWLTIRRSCFTDERVVERGPVRFSCLPRAVVDAAALAPDESGCRALLIEAVQRRLVRLDDVSHWIDVRRPNGKVRLRRALAEAAAGAWSLPEADLARLLSESSTLPAAWLNPELHESDGGRLTTPDLWFDDVAMAVMVHSRKYHAGLLDWEHGRTRLRPFGGQGRRGRGGAWSHLARPGPSAQTHRGRLRQRSPVRPTRRRGRHTTDRDCGPGARFSVARRCADPGGLVNAPRQSLAYRSTSTCSRAEAEPEAERGDAYGRQRGCRHR